jgi:PhzF family phenazine biosynthesis protein
MDEIPCFQIDAFTDRAYTGNPAAVCLLERERDAAWMQAVAAEMNLSETAFVLPRDKTFELRWFTPVLEVELCGHATLAAAHALWEAEIIAPDLPVAFATKSGTLTCTRRDDLIELDFPATPAEPAQAPAGLLEALGVEASFVGKSRFDRFVLIESEQTLRALKPDFTRLRAISMRGVIVTSASEDPGFDFVSRYFAPGSGIDEDPVTGSTHCCLAPLWSERLGKTEMTAYQASRRGGVVQMRMVGDRVILGGRAVTVLRGSLLDHAADDSA